MEQDKKISRRSIGDKWEDTACRYLEEKWYEIIARNYQIKWGEIDIVARDGEWTVFVEVRYREDDSHGHPLDTFGLAKRRALRRTAFLYVSKHGIDPDMMRIDFIGLMPKKDGTIGHHLWHVEWVEI
jgi:putative endonuclease